MAQEINFQEMLSYMRPEGSKTQRKFCNRYLRPIFGNPDKHGNYTLIVGDKPRIAFMSHHDTVHNVSGRSNVKLKNGFYTVEGANCLGADCTTGVYIMLKMIDAQVPGVYVVHAGEEIGCVGSRAIVKDEPDWFDHVDIAISFDRKGYSSVITHQMGVRTCSDAFADSLVNLLGENFDKDQGGVYTDSNEYTSHIAECTNVSVGYFSQHSKAESQDKVFLDMLIETLIEADWNALVVERKTTDYESLFEDNRFPTFGAGGWTTNYRDWGVGDWEDEKDETVGFMVDIIRDNPQAIAKILQDLGYDAYDLNDEIEDIKASIRPGRGFSKKSEMEDGYEF